MGALAADHGRTIGGQTMRRTDGRMRRAVAGVDVDAVMADVGALRARGIAADVATEWRRTVAAAQVAEAREDLAAAIRTAQDAADLDRLRAAAARAMQGGAA